MTRFGTAAATLPALLPIATATLLLAARTAEATLAAVALIALPGVAALPFALAATATLLMATVVTTLLAAMMLTATILLAGIKDRALTALLAFAALGTAADAAVLAGVAGGRLLPARRVTAGALVAVKAGVVAPGLIRRSGFGTPIVFGGVASLLGARVIRVGRLLGRIAL